MRSFQSPATFDPVPGHVVRALRQVDRSSGTEARHRHQLPQLLEALQEQARIESVAASSAIEGVVVDASRMPALVSDQRDGRFRNRNEAEFAGYRVAMDYLHNDDPGALTVGLVLHLHRLLFQFTEGRGGHFKADDNLVVERDPDGSRRVRFQPVSARDTPRFTEELVVRTDAALAGDEHHPLLVIAAFALDLLCIHPFADGNGRVARLVTAYLLERAGYGVGRYVSIEQLIYETRHGYYAALGLSTVGWFDDGRHVLWPWAGYLVERLATAYDRLEARVAAATTGGTKQDRVRDFVLLQGPGAFTIADIRAGVVGVSDQTIRLVLGELRRAGRVAVDGVGRGASWRRS